MPTYGIKEWNNDRIKRRITAWHVLKAGVPFDHPMYKECFQQVYVHLTPWWELRKMLQIAENV